MDTLNALGRIGLACGIAVAIYGLWIFSGALLNGGRKFLKRFFGRVATWLSN